MSSITISSDVANILGRLTARTEIRDAAGKLIGVFTPEVTEKTERSQPLWSQAELDEAEKILERERGQGMTLEEVMRHLHSLESSS